MSPSPLSLPPPPPPLAAVDTRSFFKLHWTCFRVLGINAPSSNTYYSVLLQVLVTLCYPFHLALALFSSPDASINIQNLTVCVTCVACSMKFVFYATRLSRIRELESIIAALDARARSLCERRYFVQLRKELRRITICFLCIYTVVGVTAELMFIFHNERNLLYPAWFPFDWRASNLKFYAAHSYQIVGISYQLLQNFVNDCFPTMALALLSAHIKLLGIRVSQIGHETASLGANEAELLHCIKDQEQLYNVLNIIQNIISLPMFLQFTVTAINLCLGMAALLYFVDAPFDRLYYLAYLLALPLQIFPICYYGTTFQLLFDKLHVEMFASNWVEQTHKFRKHMILFCERSLMSQTAMAGGIVRIHLDTFISTCKAAYSLLAVIMKMNE
ncbi:odorant receptor 59a-like [Zeugodacus cucurbitae]|uniref:Odorant receptor n=1 Tax=Zeugodacus cucurbitae TaxID=28588 RepID=A0A6M9TYG9_ZEUCU|nr:odorant receptor 59a-like [Zeugodacus cucurbitae]QKN21145.1 odorant receptor [Zeugodacus cucurbitae]